MKLEHFPTSELKHAEVVPKRVPQSPIPLLILSGTRKFETISAYKFRCL